MRLLATLATLTLAAIAPAEAKLGTGTPTIYVGAQYAYGGNLVMLWNCEQDKTADCTNQSDMATAALESWNKCLDKVLWEHKVDLLWPQSQIERDYIAQLDYRAMMAEDLLRKGLFMNELLGTCLPDKVIVTQP